MSTPRSSKYAQPLIINEPNPNLDLATYIGQRSATYRFDLIDGPTNIHIGIVHPLRDSVPALSHDTTRTIKRSLSLELGKSDTEEIDTIRTRVIPYMVFDDNTEYQLGRFMFSDSSKQRFTSGRLSSNALIDEMFIVDQSIQQSYSIGTDTTVGLGAQETTIGGSVDEAFDELLDGLNIPRRFEESGKYVVGSWPLGTSRARIIEDLALQGDFFSPWFDNHGVMRLIRVFEPHNKIPDFDFDAMNHVYYSTIAETNDLLSAPNRIIVINNGSTASTVPIVGTYDIPSSAPHSIANRGFIISDVRNMQVSSLAEANAIAANLGIRQNVYERVELSTAPDPRHDSYNVIKWDDERWLELSWTMNLIEGGEMRHIMRKTYSQ